MQQFSDGGAAVFAIGDYIAHPMHGAGVIDGVVTKKINGIERDYYVLRLPVGEMRVMVPVEGCEDIGVRPIIESNGAKAVLESFSAIEVSMTQNWNKRYRENMVKIKSGDLLEVATVVKGLMTRDRDKGLSSGERKMLHSAKQILISELVISLKSSYDQIEDYLNAAMV